MADSENVTVHVQMDIGSIENKLSELKDGLNGMKNLVANIQQVISCISVASAQTLTKVGEGLSIIGSTISGNNRILTSAVAGTSTEIILELRGILDAVKNIIGKQEEGNESAKYADFFTALNNGDEFLKRNAGLFNTSGDNPRKNNGDGTSPYINGKGQLLLPAAGESSYGKNASGGSSESGIVSGGFADLGDSFPDVTALEGLAESIGNVANKLKESAIQWGVELKAKAASRLEDLKIIAINTVEHVKAFGLLIAQLAASAGAWIAETAAKAASTAAQWAQIAATTAWQVICVAATAVTTAFGAAVAFLTSPIGLVIVAVTALIAIVVLLVKNWDTVKATVLNVWDAIMDALGSAWQWLKTTVLDPLVNGFKDVVNGIIGFINGLIEGAVKGINGVIGLLNKLQFTVPDWVPGLGGKTLGFDLKLLSAPQIPYLAKGAVLPANRPFLAVVGDQRHGTNVEAPLATIQEAVALVLEDHIGAMMAGFEALLKEQQATRRTIEGIEIGDTVIGRAAERYGRKMAVVRGGY